MAPEIIQSTSFNAFTPASSVLIFAEEDEKLDKILSEYNFWLAGFQNNTGQGFTMKVHNGCSRLLAGFQIKNKGKGDFSSYATKGFRVLGAKKEKGPWETLVQAELVDTRGKVASLVNFTF